MTEGAWVLIVAVVAATAFGVYRASVDGRFRGTHAVRGVEPVAGSGTSSTSGTSESSSDVAHAAVASPSQVARDESVPISLLDGSGVDHQLGERATLLQFSSAFCAPCRATRRILADVADLVPGVVHVEVDAEHHLDLVRRVGVTRTPTTLVLDGAGREVTRAAGAPTKDAVLATLAKELA